jgi:hypothetical protein
MREIYFIYCILDIYKRYKLIIGDDERLSRKKNGFESNDIEWIML